MAYYATHVKDKMAHYAKIIVDNSPQRVYRFPNLADLDPPERTDE